MTTEELDLANAVTPSCSSLTLEIVQRHVRRGLLDMVDCIHVERAIERVNSFNDAMHGPVRNERDLYWRVRAFETELWRMIPPAY
jgi:hypothetical protein